VPTHREAGPKSDMTVMVRLGRLPSQGSFDDARAQKLLLARATCERDAVCNPAGEVPRSAHGKGTADVLRPGYSRHDVGMLRAPRG